MNNFCSYPWTGLDINSQGQIRPCCKYKDFIADNIDDYLASPQLQKLKDQFLNGQKPIGCIRCWNDEDAQLPSKRIIDFQHVFNGIHNTNSLKVLSLSFGNTCNLTCRTCSSYASSKWVANEKKLSKIFPNIKIHKNNTFYKDNQFFEKIKSLSSEIIEITFAGGEPFIAGVNEQLDYLDYLTSFNNSQNITLNYYTNTTTFPNKKFWTKWKKFKKVNVCMSIDGIEQQFEYLRYPADWNNCYKNIKKYQEYKDQYNNLQLSISTTVSTMNILSLNKFIIWCFKEKLPFPHFGMVEYPDYYDVRTLPLEIKNLIKNKMQSSSLQSIVNYMMQYKEVKLELTKKFIDEVDAVRNQDFSSIFPEIAYIFESNKY